MASSKLKNCDSSVEAIFAAIREDASENVEYDFLGPALVKIRGNYQNHYNTSTVLDILHKYSSALPGTSPHAYRLAEELRRWALDQKSSRLVKFRGMSGSGKTDAYRSLLQHFIYTDVMQSGISGIPEERDPSKPLGFYSNPLIISPEASTTVKKLYASLCLLNVFNSAPTEKNSWSTRVGQFTQLHFSSQGRILDAVTIPVFTEMLRCNPKDPNVGPLYIQHLLVHARGKPEYLHLNSSFRDIYNHHRDIAYDSELYHLHDILVHWGGLHEEQWENMLKVVASVIHLQNVNILGSETTMISANTKNHVTIAEQLLGLETGSLLTCIMKKVDDRPSRPAGSTMECRPHESKIILDVLCNELMVRTLTSCLDHLRTNHTTNMVAFFDNKVTQDGSLCLYDPSGWERYAPQTPGNFYQYLNHYVEEKYNTFAIQEQFLGELYAYQDEGIQLDLIQQPNITQYVELLELSPGGLISLLEDASGALKPDDKVFADKAIMNFGRVKLVRAGGAKTKPTTFIVRHSYAEIAYDCDGFIMSNKLSEPSPVINNTLKTSSVSFVNAASLYAPLLSPPPPPPPLEEGKTNRLTKAKITLLYTKVLQMTDKLFAYLASCEKKNFVLCVNASTSVDDAMLTGQIQSLLIPNLVELSRFGFGYRLQFVEFFERFRILAKFEHATLPIELSSAIIHDANRTRSYSQALIDEVTAIIARLGMTEMDLSQGSVGLAVYGKTSIFIKDAFAELMERARFTFFERYTSATVRLQSFVRMKHWRREFVSIRKGVVVLQSHVLRKLQRKRFLKLYHAAWKVKGWFLTRRAAKKYQRMKTAVGLIKSKLLGKMVQRIRYQRLIRAARNFQHLARGYLLRRSALNVFDAVILLQRKFRALLTRRRKRRHRQESIERIQRCFRGHRARAKLGNLVQILKIRREQRTANQVVQKLQSIWRGKLVIARFQEIVAATIVLQGWFKSRIHFRRFQKIRSLAVWLQSQARRLSASKRTNAIKVGNMVREEKGTLASLYLQEISIIRHPKHTILTRGFTNHGCSRFDRDLLMYDISFDLTIAYPQGWLPTILSFVQDLYTKESRVIEHLVVGAQHTVLVDDFHQVYTMGLGDLGQLGHNSRKSYTSPKKLEQIQRFITQGETLAKVNASTLSASKLATQVVPKMSILSVACGQDHTLLLTHSKKIFSWGDNRRGQLGHSNFEVSTIPRLVTYTHSVNKAQVPLQNVKHIYSGKYHSACLADNGLAYIWGSGEVCMGIDRNIVLDSQTMSDVSQVDLYRVIETYYKDVNCRYDPSGIAGSGPRHVIDFCEPRSVSVLNKRKIFQLVSGEMHIAVIANDGIYTWGNNTYGQLGLGHTNDTYTVSKLSFQNHGHPHIAHAAAAGKTSGGKNLISSATNQHQQSSASNEAKEFSERDLMLSELFTGGRHMFLRTKSGTLWGWGWNKYGQVGDGTMENVLKPIRILIKDDSVAGVSTSPTGQNGLSSSGVSHHVNLRDNGNVGISSALAPKDVHNTTQLSPPTLSIIALALGWRSTMGITKSGKMFGWGIMSTLAAAVEINAFQEASGGIQYEDPSALFLTPTLLPISCSPPEVTTLLNKHTCGRGLHTTSGFALSLFMLDRVLSRDNSQSVASSSGPEEDDMSASHSLSSTITGTSVSRSVQNVAPGKPILSKTGVFESKSRAKSSEDIKKLQHRTVKLDIMRAAKASQDRKERETNARYDTKTGSQKNNTKSADEVKERFRLELGRLSLYANSTTTNRRNAILNGTSDIANSNTGVASSDPQKPSGKSSPRVGGGGAAMRSLVLNNSNATAGRNNSSPGRTFTAVRPGIGFVSPGKLQLHDLQEQSANDVAEDEDNEDEEKRKILEAEQARLEEPGALLDLFSPIHYSKIKQRRQERGTFQPPPGVGIHVSSSASYHHDTADGRDQSISHVPSSSGSLLRAHSSPPRYTQSLASASQHRAGYAAGGSPPFHPTSAPASNANPNRSPLLYLNQRHSSPSTAAGPPHAQHHSPQDYVQRIVAYEVPIASAPSKDHSTSRHQVANASSRLPATTQRSDMMFLQSFLQKTATSNTSRSLQRKQQQTQKVAAHQKSLSIDPEAPSVLASASSATANHKNVTASARQPPQASAVVSTTGSHTTRRLSALTTPLHASSLTNTALHQLHNSGGSNMSGNQQSGNGLGGLLGVSGAGDPGEFRRQMQELGYLKRLDKPRSTSA